MFHEEKHIPETCPVMLKVNNFSMKQEKKRIENDDEEKC